ncbi:suppressor of fused domain protein [Pedobacter gandavensis]|uniref:suppressor of fused domain protein n=1 Tax=Pedobacter gandavensis TaxID=2679963 RepID=UPI00292D7C1D|nr:suppressor of fused domain protein [Pedobacter gandavensis]
MGYYSLFYWFDIAFYFSLIAKAKDKGVLIVYIGDFGPSVSLEDGPNLEIMHWDNDKDIHFYWLLQITKIEVEYKKGFGLELLETKFDADDFNYLNPNRKSVG